jgi:tRNA dimethylallyltransferase
MARRLVKIIVGPTASGKTGLAIEMAKKITGGAVILNADSMQIYDAVPILAAQPDAQERATVPHKLYGTMPPSKICDASLWCDLVLAEIHQALEQGIQPILVGGTGFYIKALTNGLSPVPDIPEKDHLKAMADSHADLPAFYKELQACDPMIAAKLKPTDKQRICRAVEVYRVTGKPLSYWQEQPNILPDPSLEIEMTILRPQRDWLYDRINRRVHIMLEQGALDEVKDLMTKIDSGEVPEHAGITKAHGFDVLRKYLQDEISLEEAIDKMQIDSRQYGKRQDTWFRNQIKSGGLIKKIDYIDLPAR